MARSTYIYVLHEVYNHQPIGAFTVKHEMLTYREKHPGPTYWLRYRDGHPEIRETSGPQPNDP